MKNDQLNTNISLLENLAQAIISHPDNVSAWCEMALVPHPPVSKPDAILTECINIFKKELRNNITVSEVATIAFKLESGTKEAEQRSGRARRWAVQQHLMAVQRDYKLTTEQLEILKKVSV